MDASARSSCEPRLGRLVRRRPAPRPPPLLLAPARRGPRSAGRPCETAGSSSSRPAELQRGTEAERLARAKLKGLRAKARLGQGRRRSLGLSHPLKGRGTLSALVGLGEIQGQDGMGLAWA